MKVSASLSDIGSQATNLLRTDEVNRVLDGAVTPSDLATAVRARDAQRRLVELTAPGAKPGTHTLEPTAILFFPPAPYTVRVTTKTVRCKVALHEGGARSFDGERALVHAHAKKQVAIAEKLIATITAAIAQQGPLRTKLEELKDGSDAALGALRDRARDVYEAVGAGVVSIVESHQTAVHQVQDGVGHGLDALRSGAQAAGAKARELFDREP